MDLRKTWSSNAAQRLDCRTRRMVAVHSWSSPPSPTMASSEWASFSRTSRCFESPRTMETRRSACCSAQSTPSTSLPGGSPCRRFHEGHQIAGSIDKFGAERPCREVFVGSVFEKGTAAGHHSTCCRTGRADCPVYREGQETVVQCRGVGRVGCVPKSCTKPNCVWKGSVQRPPRNRRQHPRTSRLGSRSHETPTASGGIAVSETFLQQSPSIPPHAVVCRSSPVGGGTSFKAKGLRRGGTFNRVSTRRVVVPETFGTQGCVGDRGSISGGGVESTLGHRGRENADFVRGRFHGGEFSEVRVLHGRSRREEARYGMRASTVGEASHPGPRSDTRRSSQRQRSRSRGVPEDVLDALQFDLTQDDSDSNVQVNQRRHSPTPHSTRFGSSWPEPNVNGPCLFK